MRGRAQRLKENRHMSELPVAPARGGKGGDKAANGAEGQAGKQGRQALWSTTSGMRSPRAEKDNPASSAQLGLVSSTSRSSRNGSSRISFGLLTWIPMEGLVQAILGWQVRSHVKPVGKESGKCVLRSNQRSLALARPCHLCHAASIDSTGKKRAIQLVSAANAKKV